LKRRIVNRKIARWSNIKQNFLIFGPVLIFGLLVVLLLPGKERDHGHSHSDPPVSQVVAKEKARKMVARLIDSKKLDGSWSSAKVSSAKTIFFKKYHEWEVIFVNKNITDPAKQKIYVFLTLSGEHVAINYSGK